MADDSKRKLCDMDEMDESTIENKPWAHKLLTTSLEITKKAVLNWCNIVTKIGDTDLDVEEYVSVFIQQVEALYEDLIVDVDSLQQKSLHKIVSLLEQMQNLCRDLHVDMPTFNYEEVSLGDLRQVIVQRIEEYQTLVDIRKKELRELQQKQMKLCKNLGREPKIVAESPLPLPAEVEDLRVYIEGLENEIMEREERFFQLREQVLEIVQELKATPSLNFEQEILSLSNTEVRIGDSEMEQLEQYCNRLVKQVKTVREDIVELRSKVDDLWDKLETDIAERDAFRQKNTGNSLETLKALKLEVKRLEEQKKANIKVFIMKQRQELVEMWEKCHCTEEDRKTFTFYHSECFNEDLFELHEREVSKWKLFYDENQELFELLQEHKRLWHELLDLECNSGGMNRYKNRGGQLLLEEKLRNKLAKRIPKIEENLTRLSEAFFTRKGRPFLSFGQTIEEYVTKLHDDREKDFKLKLSAKKQQREQASVIGKSRRNLFTPSSSNLNPTLTPRSIKRKVFHTPTTEPVKKLKTVQNKSCKTGMPKLNVSKNRRLSRNKRRNRLRLSFKSSMNSDKENHNDTASTSYNAFEIEVSNRGNCRSTGFVLKESNNLATVIVTPATPVRKAKPVEVFQTPRGISQLQKTSRPATSSVKRH